MSVLSTEFVGDGFSVDYSSIFELGVKTFYFSQYRKLDGFASQKNLYCSIRNDFTEKFRLKYRQATDPEILNF